MYLFEDIGKIKCTPRKVSLVFGATFLQVYLPVCEEIIRD
jgi:hypothetical protein